MLGLAKGDGEIRVDEVAEGDGEISIDGVEE
jgi:hypothetical protein